MLDLKALDQVGDTRRLTHGAGLADRVAATVDGAPQSLGFLARGHPRPSWPRADGVAPLDAIGLAPVVENP